MANNRPKPDIDIALTALVIHARPEQTLNYSQIAEVCGCTKAAIMHIGNRAEKKAHKAILRMGISRADLFQ